MIDILLHDQIHLSWWARLALLAMADGVLTPTRLGDLLAHVAEQPTPVTSPLCLTTMQPVAGNAYRDGSLTLEWRWWPSAAACDHWRTLSTANVPPLPSVDQIIAELAIDLGVVPKGVFAHMAGFLVRSGKFSPGWIARQQEDRYAIPVTHAVIPRLVGMECCPQKGVATSSRGVFCGRMRNDPVLARELRIALTLHGPTGMAAFCEHPHDGVVVIATHLTHRANDGLAPATYRNLVETLLPLTREEFEACLSGTRAELVALCEELLTATPQRSTDSRRAVMHSAIASAVAAGRMEDDSFHPDTKARRRLRVRAIALAEWQWRLLLREWRTVEHGWYGAAGLILLLLWGRVGLRLEESLSIRLADASDDAVIFRATSRYRGKTRNAPRRIPLKQLLLPDELCLWQQFLVFQRSLLSGVAKLQHLSSPLLLSADGHVPVSGVRVSRWVSGMINLLAGVAVGGAHALRHIAITRLSALLQAPLPVAAAWCSLSEADVRARRAALTDGGSIDAEALIRAINGHAIMGDAGEVYRQDGELTLALSRGEVSLPAAGAFPELPEMLPPAGAGSTPDVALMPAMILAAHLGEPAELGSWAQNWLAAAARVTTRRRRKGGPFWVLDESTRMPLITHQWQREVAIAGLHSLTALPISNVRRLAERVRAAMCGPDRPGIRYCTPAELKKEIGLWKRAFPSVKWELEPEPSAGGCAAAQWTGVRKRPRPRRKQIAPDALVHARLVPVHQGRLAGRALEFWAFAISVLDEFWPIVGRAG